MQEKPEEYAATQAVYEILREALSTYGMTPEAYLATKSVKGMLAEGIQSISRSGSKDQLRPGTPEVQLAQVTVANVLREGLNSSERKLRAQSPLLTQMQPEGGNQGEGEDYVDDMSMGDHSSLGSLENYQFGSSSSPYKNTEGMSDEWSQEVDETLMIAEEAFHQCDYGKSELTLTTLWKRLLSAIQAGSANASRGGGSIGGGGSQSAPASGSGLGVIPSSGAKSAGEIDHLKALSATVQVALGHTELALARYEEARRLFAVAGAIRSSLYTDQSVAMAEVTEGLALCAMRQALYDEAEAQFQAAKQSLNVAANSLIRTADPCVGMPRTRDEIEALTLRISLGQAELAIIRGDYLLGENMVREVMNVLPTVDGLAASSRIVSRQGLGTAQGQRLSPIPGRHNFDPMSSPGDNNSVGSTGSLGSGTINAQGSTGTPWSPAAELIVTCVELEGKMAQCRGKYDRAIKLFRKVLVSRTQLLGLSHSSIATTLGTLAECEIRRCNYKEALKLTKAAIEMNLRYLKSSHPLYLDLLNTKIKIAVAIGKYDTALEGAEDGYARRKESLAPLSGETISPFPLRFDALRDICLHTLSTHPSVPLSISLPISSIHLFNPSTPPTSFSTHSFAPSPLLLLVHPTIADSLWTLAEATRASGKVNQHILSTHPRKHSLNRSSQNTPSQHTLSTYILSSRTSFHLTPSHHPPSPSTPPFCTGQTSDAVIRRMSQHAMQTLPPHKRTSSFHV